MTLSLPGPPLLQLAVLPFLLPFPWLHTTDHISKPAATPDAWLGGWQLSAAPESCPWESGGHQLTWGQLRGFWKMGMSGFQ